MGKRFDFPNMSDAELDAEFALWHTATVGSRVPAWIDFADRCRNAITAERARRKMACPAKTREALAKEPRP